MAQLKENFTAPNISMEGLVYSLLEAGKLSNWRRRDGLGGMTERHPDLNVDPEVTRTHPQLDITPTHGVDVALDILRSYPPRSVTYVVLGPMTNLLQMMRKDGGMVRERIGRIVSMGGAFDVPGNTTPVAECRDHFFPESRHNSDRYSNS